MTHERWEKSRPAKKHREAGKYVRARRETMRVGITPFAARLGVTAGTLTQWELGDVHIPLTRCHAVATALDMPTSTLLEMVLEDRLHEAGFEGTVGVHGLRYIEPEAPKESTDGGV